MDTVKAFTGPTCACPAISIYIGAESVCTTVELSILYLQTHRSKGSSVLQFLTIDYVPHGDSSWPSGINYEELFVIWGETKSVWLLKFVYDQVHLRGFGIDAIDTFLDEQLSFVAFVVHHAAVAGIRKPNPAVRVDHDVIGRIKRFALPFISEHGDATAMLVANNSSRTMFAG